MPERAPSWWAERSLQAAWLLPLAAFFFVVSSFRRLLWQRWRKPVRLDVPVIIVGNVATGGSGKTPVVLWLVQALQTRGWHPGIISRGYGGSLRGPCAVFPDSMPKEVGDEPVLLARRSGVPVFIGRDRPAAGAALRSAHPEVDVLVSDDGLQHYRLHRDAEIVVIDEKVLGNRWLLPAGPMRELLRRVREAQLVILHGACSPALLSEFGATPRVSMSLRPGRFYRLDDPSQQRDAASFVGQSLKAIAGIGRPERFFESLRALGLEPTDTCAFPDHHPFQAADLALQGAQALLITEKDAIKCAGLAPSETWVLPVNAEIDAVALDHVLEPLHGSQAA